VVTNEYKIAYAEILEILKHIAKKERDKVPSNMREMFKANASKDSNFVYNPRKTLQEQKVSEIAISIIAILYRDYWATKEQKQKILSYQYREREKIKSEKYNANQIFKNINESVEKSENESITVEKSLVTIKKQNFMQKIIEKCKWIKQCISH